MMHAWQLVQAASQSTTNSSTNHTAGKQQQQQQSLEQLGLLLPGESVLIVGGGLTSAHLAQIAASQLRQNAQNAQPFSSYPSSGVTTTTDAAAAGSSDKVYSAYADSPAPISLLMRGPWRVKQFDVDVPFMGRLRGKKLQEFGQLRSFPKRLALIKQVLQVSS
jgi:hypothetical protein